MDKVGTWDLEDTEHFTFSNRYLTARLLVILVRFFSNFLLISR